MAGKRKKAPATKNNNVEKSDEKLEEEALESENGAHQLGDEIKNADGDVESKPSMDADKDSKKPPKKRGRQAKQESEKTEELDLDDKEMAESKSKKRGKVPKATESETNEVEQDDEVNESKLPKKRGAAASKKETKKDNSSNDNELETDPSVVNAEGPKSKRAKNAKTQEQVDSRPKRPARAAFVAASQKMLVANFDDSKKPSKTTKNAATAKKRGRIPKDDAEEEKEDATVVSRGSRKGKTKATEEFVPKELKVVLEHCTS